MFKNLLQSVNLSVFLTSALPVALLGFAVFWALSTTFNFLRSTESEIDGVRAIRHLYHAISDLQDIRSMRMQQLSSPDPDLAERLRFLQRDFISDFSDDHWPQLPVSLGIDAHIRDLLEQATPLMTVAPTRHNARELLRAHDQLIELLLTAVRRVMDRSTLTLDTEIDTYYLMDISIRHLPALSTVITKIHAHAIRLNGGPDVAAVEQAVLRDLIIEGRTLMHAMRHSLEMVDRSSPQFREALDTALALFASHTVPLASHCAQGPCGSDFQSQLTPFVNNALTVRHHFDSVFYIGTDLLIQRLFERRDRYHRNLAITLFVTGCAMLAALFVMFYYSRKLNLSYQQLELASQTDPLTGIPNRRTLESSFLRSVSLARRARSSFALAMIDIDFFKPFNDTQGHQRGDQVLQAVAGVLRNSFQRGQDFYFRYGGEEFCFFTPVRDASELAHLCETLRLGVADLAIAHPGNPPDNIVTVSVGAIFVPDLDAQPLVEELVREADCMLYVAKNHGRNRVEISTLNPDSAA